MTDLVDEREGQQATEVPNRTPVSTSESQWTPRYIREKRHRERERDRRDDPFPPAGAVGEERQDDGHRDRGPGGRVPRWERVASPPL